MSGLECNSKKGYHYWWDNVPGGGKGGGDGGGNNNNNNKQLTREESLRLEEEITKVKGSKWNAAQTFEERSYVAWAETTLNEILRRRCKDELWFASEKEHIKSKEVRGGWRRTFLLLSVKKLSGNCSIVLSRGKMKHGLDLEATEFEIKATYTKGEDFDYDDGYVEVDGTFTVPEISIETIADDEFEIRDAKAKEPKEVKDENERKALKEDCELFMKDLKGFVTGACEHLEQKLAEKAND